MQTSINAKTHAASAVPAWLNGKAVGQWVSIPNTGQPTYQALKDAGLDRTPADWNYGEPHKGIVGYSGGCVKGGSTLLIFGGGGSNAWAGNEVRMLPLAADAPTWSLLAQPSNASATWPKQAGQTSHAYMQDWKPNARHSYWSPQFIDANGDFMMFGCVDVWETDSGRFLNVDSYNVASASWRPQGYHPDMPHQRAYDGNWLVKHPVTEDVYVCAGTFLSRWNRSSNTWTDIANALDTGMDRAFAALDPNTGKILRIGSALTNGTCQRIDIVTGAVVPGNLVGPHAADVNLSDFAHYNGSGFVYDLGLGAYLLFQNAATIFKITPSGNDWSVDLFPTTGTPPEIRTDMAPGSGIWGRFAYVPTLKGVAFMSPGANSPWTQNTFFVQTS